MTSNSGTITFGTELPAAADIRIIDIISEGTAFRTVKAAVGTKYVILKASISGSAMDTALLRREYELSRCLSHPGIAATIGFLESSPVGPAIELEYIEGVTLDMFLQAQISCSVRKSILYDIMDSVGYLHRKGVVHNDLKPANILVTANNAVKIIDFGLSSSADSAYSGVTGGTCGYSAPELRKGVSIPASDIYSIGKLIELVFCGKRYRSIIRKCTVEDITHRFQNTDSLKSAIRKSDIRHTLTATAAIFSLSLLTVAVYSAWHSGHFRPPYQPLSPTEYIDSLYDAASSRIASQPYSEFAEMGKAEYNHFYAAHIGILPPQERYECDSIYKTHIRIFNTMIESKPSLYTEEPDSQVVLLNRLMEGSYFK